MNKNDLSFWLSPGGQIFAIGVIHNLVGVAISARLIPDEALSVLAPNRTPFSELLRGGVALNGAPDAVLFAFFWFFFFGFAFMLLGEAMRALERVGQASPASVVVGLFALTTCGVVVMPASGFWLAFAPVGLLLLRYAGGRRVGVA